MMERGQMTLVRAKNPADTAKSDGVYFLDFQITPFADRDRP